MMRALVRLILQSAPRYARWRLVSRYRQLQQQAALLQARIADDDLELQYLFEEMRLVADQAACLPSRRMTAANDAPPHIAALHQLHQQEKPPCA